MLARFAVVARDSGFAFFVATSATLLLSHNHGMLLRLASPVAPPWTSGRVPWVFPANRLFYIFWSFEKRGAQ